MKARWFALLLCALAMLVAMPARAQDAAARKVVRVGVVVDGPGERMQAMGARFRAEIDTLSKQSQSLQREKRTITSELNALKSNGDGMFALDDEGMSLGGDDDGS